MVKDFTCTGLHAFVRELLINFGFLAVKILVVGKYVKFIFAYILVVANFIDLLTVHILIVGTYKNLFSPYLHKQGAHAYS